MDELGRKPRSSRCISKAGPAEAFQYDVYINHWPVENPEDLSQEEFRTFAEEHERRFARQPPSGSGYPYVVAPTA